MVAYRYYVVYEIWEEGRIIGKGVCEAALKRKITSVKDVDEIAELVKKDKAEIGDGQVVVVNYMLMDEVEIGEEGR